MDLKETLEPLLEHREELRSQLRTIEKQKQEVRKELAKVERVLRSGELIPPANAGTRKSRQMRNDNGTFEITEEHLNRVRELAAARTAEGEKFTLTQAREALVPIQASGRAEAVIDRLRTNNEIRLDGKVRGGGRGYVAVT